MSWDLRTDTSFEGRLKFPGVERLGQPFKHLFACPVLSFSTDYGGALELKLQWPAVVTQGRLILWISQLPAPSYLCTRKKQGSLPSLSSCLFLAVWVWGSSQQSIFKKPSAIPAFQPAVRINSKGEHHILIPFFNIKRETWLNMNICGWFGLGGLPGAHSTATLTLPLQQDKKKIR